MPMEVLRVQMLLLQARSPPLHTCYSLPPLGILPLSYTLSLPEYPQIFLFLGADALPSLL